MIRSNLSTRPFYNERAVHLAIGGAALVVLALTAVNVVRVLTLSRQNTEYSRRINGDRVEMEQLATSATEVRRGIDQKELQVVVDSAREANALIDQRTFSWTAFFDIVEKTLPLDARLVAVAPRIERGAFMIQMQLNVKRPEDLEAFMDSLLGTGTFYDLLPGEQQLNDDGTFAATLVGGYFAPGTFGPPSKAPARKGANRP